MKVKIALALNNENVFEKTHFGDADKYKLFSLDSNSCDFISEEINNIKLSNIEEAHGSKEKGKAIIELLKKQDVNVLVSRQFGPNIKIIAEHFVPVIIYKESVEDVCELLIKNFHWVEDELDSNKQIFKKFIIKDGIMKTGI